MMSQISVNVTAINNGQYRHKLHRLGNLMDGGCNIDKRYTREINDTGIMIIYDIEYHLS